MKRRRPRAAFPRSQVPKPGALATTASAMTVAFSTLSCGGGGPLLHPAQALRTGDVRATGGISANFVPSGLGTALYAARDESPSAPSGAKVDYPTDPTYAKGALIAAAVAPGLAPFASGRFGVGSRFEAGLTYTGRAVRADVRRSFDYGDVSLSVGGGVSYIFHGDQGEASLPYVDVSSIEGYGADVPVLIGWQSAARLLMVWGGVRGGFDRIGIGDTNPSQFPVTPTMSSPGELSATRFYGGGLVGVAGGFRHIHVALELDLAYQTITGSFFATHATISGLSVAPAGGVWVDF